MVWDVIAYIVQTNNFIMDSKDRFPMTMDAHVDTPLIIINYAKSSGDIPVLEKLIHLSNDIIHIQIIERPFSVIQVLEGNRGHIKFQKKKKIL